MHVGTAALGCPAAPAAERSWQVVETVQTHLPESCPLEQSEGPHARVYDNWLAREFQLPIV